MFLNRVEQIWDLWLPPVLLNSTASKADFHERAFLFCVRCSRGYAPGSLWSLYCSLNLGRKKNPYALWLLWSYYSLADAVKAAGISIVAVGEALLKAEDPRKAAEDLLN